MGLHLICSLLSMTQDVLISLTPGASYFFKGVTWAAQAAKLCYRWKVGNGKLKFWEDNRLGSSSLAIQFWDLYEIVNEKNGTIHDLWDGENLKCISAVWSLKIPPRVRFFLWLLSRRQNLTRDVLESREKHLEDNTCPFCSERETSHHLFFECVVAKQVWAIISELLGLEIGSDFESVGSRWLSNKRFLVHNMFSSATL